MSKTICPNGHTDVELASNKLINANSLRGEPSANLQKVYQIAIETGNFALAASIVGAKIDRQAFELFLVCKVCGARFSALTDENEQEDRK